MYVCSAEHIFCVKITTVSSAIGFWHVKDVFFPGMWWLFHCSTMSRKVTPIFDTTHSSVLSLLTPVSPKIHPPQRWKVTWPRRADRSPCRTYSCPTKLLVHVLRSPKGHKTAAVAQLFAAGAVSSLEPLRRCPVPLCPGCRWERCLGSAWWIQPWVGVSASKGDARFTRGVIKL